MCAKFLKETISSTLSKTNLVRLLKLIYPKVNDANNLSVKHECLPTRMGFAALVDFR